MNTHLLTTLTLSALALSANAQTVLLEEDFDQDYTKSFAYFYDGDQLTPHSSIAPFFMSSATGTTQPWWVVRDSNEATDKFMASHAYYQASGKSFDWLISVPLEIPTDGFLLEFDAQSVNVRGTQYISDLSVYITEKMITLEYIPETPTFTFENVPYGNDLDNCEGDWTHYCVSLDPYAGKTIYVNFVNENYDKDIVCIDNVKVWRNDAARFTLLPYEKYTCEDHTHLYADVEFTSEEPVGPWRINVYANGEKVSVKEGTPGMKKGDVVNFEETLSPKTGETTDFALELEVDGYHNLTLSGSVTKLAFMTTHRVFFEETTSLHCGNCPLGIYTVESMLEDENMRDRIVPVSVHIASMGYDPMATDTYYESLPVFTAAPLVFVDRNIEYDGFVPAYDCNYDPQNINSFANRILRKAEELVPFDISVDGQWVIEGNDTTAITCTATVTPAVNVKGKQYRVAFILTENNVGLDFNPYWLQENYLSGKQVDSHCGGWTDLDDKVINARYHDVARAISEYDGHYRSLPTDMDAAAQYTYTYKMSIPDTYYESNGFHLSDAIHRQFCAVSAILIDCETGLVVNAARTPMSAETESRYTIAQLVEAGINDVVTDPTDDESSAVYYDLAGRRILNPDNGIYIRRTPAKVTKVIK